MEQHSRATLGAGSLRFLNQPRQLSVSADAQGTPEGVIRHGHYLPVVAVQDIWRIDSDWWRPRPIHRLYFLVVLGGGLLTTIYHDLLSGEWYEQRYG